MHLPKGLYKRGKSYYLDYTDEAGKRVRRSVGPDFHKCPILRVECQRTIRGRLQCSQIGWRARVPGRSDTDSTAEPIDVPPS